MKAVLKHRPATLADGALLAELPCQFKGSTLAKTPVSADILAA
jgi:hypothetical protein